MNAPESLRPSLPALPPFTPHPQPGTAPRIDPGLPDGWSPGFAGLAADLEEPFTRPCDPSPLQDCRLLAVSEDAAALMGLDAHELMHSPAWLALLSGNAVGSIFSPMPASMQDINLGSLSPDLAMAAR